MAGSAGSVPSGRAAKISRFGVYQLDHATGELRKSGNPVKVQDQPARMLVLLVENAGRIVTREELQAALWPEDTFVEFDASLNTAVRKLRQALQDSADNPRFVETVPRQGYRFIAPVHYVAGLKPEAVPAPAPPAEAAPERQVRGSGRIRWAVFAAGVAGLAVAAWLIRARPDVPAGVTTRAVIEYPPGATVAHAFGPSIAISHDGRWIAIQAAIGGQSRIFWRRIDDFEWHAIPGSEGMVTPFFLADNRHIVAYSRDGKLRELSLNGPVGDVAAVNGGGTIPTSAFAAADGSIYYSGRPPAGGTRRETSPALLGTGIWRVRPGSGEAPELLSFNESPDAGEVRQTPHQLLPNGAVLFTASRSPRDRQIMALEPATGRIRALLAQGMGAWYLPTGHLAYYWGGKILAVPFDAGGLSVRGEGVPVINGVGVNGWSADAAVSGNGTLIYTPHQREVGDRTLVRVDLEGHTSAVPLAPGPYQALDLSRDGKRLLLTKRDGEDGTWQLASYELAAGSWTTLVKGASLPINAVWMADGGQVVYGSDHDGRRFHNLFRRAVDPLGPEMVLTRADFGQYPNCVTPDGKAVLFAQGYDPQTAVDIFELPLAGDGRVSAVVRTPGRDAHPAVSPDGKWLAYTGSVNGRYEVLVQAYPGTGPAAVISPEGGEGPLWSREGKEIYYRSGRKMMAVRFVPGAAPHGSAARVLFEGDYLRADNWFRNAILSADGKQFLLLKEDPPEEQHHLNVVVNWFDEVRRLVPR